jgi:hypothetical protein
MKFFAMLTAASIVTCGAVAQESNVAAQMNTIVYGKPVFMLDGKPFTPPVVAGEDEGEAAPSMTFAPIPYLPAELKKQMPPHQRIEHSFSVFE